jgi:diguanylate cyclase (GGDEF)-like protein
MRQIFLRVGYVRACILLVVIAIFLSFVITAGLLLLRGHSMTQNALIASLVTPGVIAAFFSTIILRLIYDLDATEQRFKKLATQDELTGIHNRRSFLELAARELARAKRYGVEFSMVVIDIDDFKRVNDQYGHLMGDKVLTTLAQYCQDEIRKSDILARIGGDEFVMLISQSEQIDLAKYIQRLQCRIQTVEFVDAPDLTITASMGGARYVPKIETISQLLNLADEMMYQTKGEKLPC